MVAMSEEEAPLISSRTIFVDNSESEARITEPEESQEQRNSEYLKAVDDGELETVTQVVHFGFCCDGCGMDPITGIRYGKLLWTHC